MISLGVKKITEPSESEPEHRDPKQIALAAFRFRARRGIGVFYASLSTIPVLVTLLNAYPLPGYVYVVSLVLLMIAIWLVSRAAGMRGFTHMSKAIDLYDHVKQKSPKKRSDLLKLTRALFLFIFPFALFALIASYNQNALAAAVIFVWVIVWALLNILSYSRQSKDGIVCMHIEDWIALPITMGLLILNSLPVVGLWVKFGFAAPVLLVAGVKSLYEAPEELVRSNE
jgi:hypothetical protein